MPCFLPSSVTSSAPTRLSWSLCLIFYPPTDPGTFQICQNTAKVYQVNEDTSYHLRDRYHHCPKPSSEWWIFICEFHHINEMIFHHVLNIFITVINCYPCGKSPSKWVSSNWWIFIKLSFHLCTFIKSQSSCHIT